MKARTVPKRAMSRWLPILAGLLAVAACDRAPRLNVLIVTLDTTRADHLGAYGYEAIETPAIDRLAAEGALFTSAFTPVPITLPSHTTIMTGTYPQYHGVRDNDNFVDDSVETLAEVLAARGYRTAAFVSAYPLHQQFNLAQGFEVYDDEFESDDWRFLKLPFHEQFFFDERAGGGTTHAALQWLDGLGPAPSDPFFLWVHYFDPHANYHPPAPFDEIYAHSPYDGEIANVDRALGRLIESLRATGQLDRTVFVLTADHGESLDDHGELTHALLLYDATLHVPLIIRAPGVKRARIEATARTLDVLPTVLDLLAIPTPAAVQGRSLRPLLEGRADLPEREVYHESPYTFSKYGWSMLRAYRWGDFKLIEEPRPELYAWRSDRREAEDLAPAEPERIDGLRRSLYRLLAETKSGRPPRRQSTLDAETRERLEALGYLGADSHAPELDFDQLRPSEPSPKAMMPVWKRYNEVKTLIRERQPRWQVLLEKVRRLHAEDAGSGYYARYLEALVHLGRGDYDRARELLTALIREHGPVDYSAVLELATLELKHGEPEEARRLFGSALELRPEEPRLYFYLGWAAELLGEPEQAERDYRQALAFDPDHSQALMNLGNLLNDAGREAESEGFLKRAAAAAPYRPETHYNLGVVYYRRGEDERGRLYFERAVKIDPAYDQARFALASSLLALGAVDEARRELAHLVRHGTDNAFRTKARELMAGLSQPVAHSD